MKKTMYAIAIAILLVIVFAFSGNTYAASLDTLTFDVSKSIVRPGETVKLTIHFGRNLGAYTFNIAYDNHLFDYVSVDGGTANNTADKIKVAYYDSTGGSNPRNNMSILFKAKEGITTSNPTEFTLTAEGLANADASETYDDITTPIIKNVTVEPEYKDYTFKLDYTGNIIKEQEKDMVLSYSSSMGHYYEHARLVAEATTPAGANVRLMATDQTKAQHDIIQSGWGDPAGYKIGGKDVSQILNTRAIFSQEGNYTITLKLIDRDNSDQVIAQKQFSFNVLKEEPAVEQATPEKTQPNTEETKQESTKEALPSKLPKTGDNIYFPAIVLVIGLIGLAIQINRKK